MRHKKLKKKKIASSPNLLNSPHTTEPIKRISRRQDLGLAKIGKICRQEIKIGSNNLHVLVVKCKKTLQEKENMLVTKVPFFFADDEINDAKENEFDL